MAFADAVYLTASATLFSFSQRHIISSSALGGAFAPKSRSFPLQYTKYCCGKAPIFDRKIPRRPLSPNYAVLPLSYNQSIAYSSAGEKSL